MSTPALDATLGPAAPAAAGAGAASAGRTRTAAGLRRWAVRSASLAAVVAVWQWLTTADARVGLRFDRLPSPAEVAAELGRQLGTRIYYLDLAQSMIRILTGFALAAVAGIALGVLVARSRWAGDVLLPPIEVVRPIPAIALVPIAILVFPTDEQGIVFITFAAAFFPIMVSTRHAVRALPTLWEDAVRTMGGGRAHVLWNVVLPGTLPGVFGGLSVGMGVAWICVISAEMISGEFGVGYRTWHAYTVVDYPAVLVGMASIGVLGWVASASIELLGRRLTRWLHSSDQGADQGADQATDRGADEWADARAHAGAGAGAEGGAR
ncbi:ABC transporter permease [Microbispora bryophytorum]|uniref:Putative nitrate ABC transporter, permease protein n=1 Tax=Microbispora bryophytorum TaxID=1460882 RepID=A0A8H9HA46_9ACTN|nr:ABC transporter permease [Microbispora bryophytorum]MBD3139932.1 ABC transporter permease [Microbispora bryophytorum]TQS01592.1 ABC transporter permease [Microbispora bryophytorum]GGO28801.1 putative nitrate ABC transporter, permease protein [Microbispora bryophytorum]